LPFCPDNEHFFPGLLAFRKRIKLIMREHIQLK